MFPLSPILNAAGWTTRGLLLPGFGAQIDRPTLVLQGRRDPVVKPEFTRQLIRQFAGPVEYTEIDAQHDLIDPALPDWPQLERSLLEFVEQSHFTQ